MDAGHATKTHEDPPRLFAALEHNLYIQAIVTAFVVCFCTRILSSHWFQSVKYGNGHGIEPPTLPYWIPGLKHAFSMGYDSKKFLANCL